MSCTDITAVTKSINAYISKVIAFLEKQEILVSPEKSTAIPFPRDLAKAKMEWDT